MPDAPLAQVILHLYGSVGELLMGFDLDACCVAYDGRSVLCLPRCARALRRGYNLCGVDASRLTPGFEARALKYALRGFAVAAPLCARWRELLRPSAVAAERGAAFAGFAKLVAWEAALLANVELEEQDVFYDCALRRVSPSLRVFALALTHRHAHPPPPPPPSRRRQPPRVPVLAHAGASVRRPGARPS